MGRLHWNHCKQDHRTREIFVKEQFIQALAPLKMGVPQTVK